MSVQAMTAVIGHSQHGGSTLLVLMMVANHAHADGTNAFPSIRTLAEETRMSERAVQYQLRRLEESGELIRKVRDGKTAMYAIALPGLGVQTLHPLGANGNARGVQSDVEGGAESGEGGASTRTEGVQPVAPEPRTNRQILQPSENQELAPRSATRARDPVFETLALAEGFDYADPEGRRPNDNERGRLNRASRLARQSVGDDWGLLRECLIAYRRVMPPGSKLTAMAVVNNIGRLRMQVEEHVVFEADGEPSAEERMERLAAIVDEVFTS